ncbi:predicted protein [Histoplasma mississippiense (nom. inval.)]|uniref:predicted protein n=1 Tax=Ajellomyces capsulatus (strain NAm1 / WU24) TaxID=2059318 RepID=UPI000157C2CD|nr:predicted protein [Histoplasma mississippiense (nom. inval.)]EDN07234.1 predicted protein [Histoplasma mississippiense (nom. inval.)]
MFKMTESSSHNRGVCWASMGLMNKILLQCASNAEDIVAKEEPLKMVLSMQMTEEMIDNTNENCA